MSEFTPVEVSHIQNAKLTLLSLFTPRFEQLPFRDYQLFIHKGVLMTTRTLTCPLPSSINPLSPNGYMFTLQRLPELSYFCQEVSLPAITLPEATQLNPFSKIPLSGDQIDFDTLRVQFLIDEKMENYKAIHDWIVGLGFPENNSQYTQYIEGASMPGISEVAKSSSDATLETVANTPYAER